MNASRRLARPLLMAVVLMASTAVLAQNIFNGLTSTADGHHTWDSDLINIEKVPQTGGGVYVAVLDNGMAPNWRDYFPEARVATHLGAGFYQPVTFKAKKDVCGVGIEVGTLRTDTWVGSRVIGHGTHVASTILGYFYRSNYDEIAGFPLPPIVVRGIAPEVTVIPIRVIADYQLPALPKCDAGYPSGTVTFGTDSMIAAGIRYATDLKLAGFSPMVINMSLGGPVLAGVVKDAIDYATSNGVIVVAAAGNAGVFGMGYPGAYPPVISVGAAGWTGEWIEPGGTPSGPRYRMWWLQDSQPSSLVPPLLNGSGDVAEPITAGGIYVAGFSSRALPGQQLDVLAPGSWVRGPMPGAPGYSRLPWWSKGIGDLVGRNANTNFFYLSGTSQASPHVASVAAMIMQKNPTLVQAQVESIIKSSALSMPPSGSRIIFDLFEPNVLVSWNTDCGGGVTCDAVGAGLIQADAALALTPSP